MHSLKVVDYVQMVHPLTVVHCLYKARRVCCYSTYQSLLQIPISIVSDNTSERHIAIWTNVYNNMLLVQQFKMEEAICPLIIDNTYEYDIDKRSESVAKMI